MQRIFFDDIFLQVTFGCIETDTSILKAGGCIACLYGDKWYIGIIMDRCNENNDVKVKLLRHCRLCLSWCEHDNQFWV